MEVSDGETAYLCNLCHDYFETSESVEIHIISDHGQDLENSLWIVLIHQRLILAHQRTILTC